MPLVMPVVGHKPSDNESDPYSLPERGEPWRSGGPPARLWLFNELYTRGQISLENIFFIVLL